ncbi:MAG TPA: LexA family transcriptional regulator [Flavobacterium sp.]|jgi:transcriptional regulator with XRE-family HTH domain
MLTIKELRERKKISQSALAQKLNVSLRTVQNYEADQNKIPLDKLTKIYRELELEVPDGVSLESMLIDNSKINKEVEAIRVNYNIMNVMYVPLVNQFAYGGYLSGFGDPEFIEELPKIPFAADQEHKGKYICFEAKGDSMDDGTDEAIKERDILLCRDVNKEYWKSKLHINKWDFVIVHKERGIVIKRIIKHDVENGILTLHSLNDFYEDYEVNINDIEQILNIVDIQRKKNRR